MVGGTAHESTGIVTEGGVCTDRGLLCDPSEFRTPANNCLTLTAQGFKACCLDGGSNVKLIFSLVRNSNGDLIQLGDWQCAVCMCSGL